ncbi:nitroreductase family protein [Chloroflexota bacterium]
MDYDALLEMVKRTRSIRRFKPDPIPDEYIDKIIEVARWAPSGFNQQPWEFVVVKNLELRKKIAEYTGIYWSQSREMEATRESWQGAWNPEPVGSEADYSLAPVYILLFGDVRAMEGLPMGVRFDHNRREIIFVSSLANAFLYMHMATSTLGLASQWVSAVATPYTHCMIKNLLGINKELEIYDMLAVGYPAVRPRPKLMRDKDQLIHYDHCGSETFRTDEQVRDYISKSRTWTMACHKRKPDKRPK